MEIAFAVEGWPPAKGEALSMFGPSHPHAPRVRVLLEAARGAQQKSEWDKTSEPVGLELIVVARPGQDPWDATNYLGGVADTLQDKSRSFRGLDLEHFGALRAVALYENDRQIREIHYRQVAGDAAGYSVRIWKLK